MSNYQPLIDAFTACFHEKKNEKKFEDFQPLLVEYIKPKLIRVNDLFEDVLYDTVIRVWKSLQSLKALPENIPAYLNRVIQHSGNGILKNKINRREKETPLEECIDAPTHAEHPLERMEREQRSHTLKQFLKTLKKDHAQVCLLHWCCDMKKVEISHELGIPESSVNTIIDRTKLKIAKHFRRQEFFKDKC